MDNREIVNYEIIKIAVDKGYKGYNTYHQLIEWVFSELNENIIENNIQHLEFWYNLLKDCPLAYEFKGRVLEWFRILKYDLYINSMNTYFGYRISYNCNPSNAGNIGDSYNDAEHKGILEIFKMLKNE